MRHRRTVRIWAPLVLAVVALVAVGPVGPALAAHGAAANFTVQPVDDSDRQPGIEDASYYSFSKPPDQAEFDGFRYLEYSILEWEAGTLGMCGLGDTVVAGIDRDDDDPGTTVDDPVQDNVEGQPVANEDRVVIDFDDPGKIGHSPVHMNVTDEFVSHVSDCRGNPDTPGWYQLTGTINGTTWSDEHVERTTTSHYFYICDCSSYDEAVETIGPPPSREAEPTPTATPSAGEETPQPTATADGETATATRTTHLDPTATATPSRSTDATPTSEPTGPTATPTPAEWARNTVAQGPGFGATLALLAVVLAVGLRRRRR